MVLSEMRSCRLEGTEDASDKPNARVNRRALGERERERESDLERRNAINTTSYSAAFSMQHIVCEIAIDSTVDYYQLLLRDVSWSPQAGQIGDDATLPLIGR